MIAILLAGMSSGVMGGLVTTALIVVFGEIIPQSVCSRHALAIGATSVPLVWFFLVFCYPVAYPISLILDKVLGKEISAVYTKHELLELITLNVDDPAHNLESGIKKEEGHMLKGALTYRDGKIKDVMTDLDVTYMISIDAVLDKKTVLEMLELGHTRIPVFKGTKETVVGILYAKDLVGLGFERKTPVSNVINTMKGAARVHFIDVNETLGTANDMCRDKCVHMLVVRGASNKACGVITTEDILEEILQYEIIGDDDKFIDNKTERKSSSAKSQRKIIQRANSKRYDPTAMVKGLV
jgi:metal transporter CNNM